MRQALSNKLVDMASKNSNLILLTGDHGYALFDEFRKIFPEKYINAGVAEQNMVGMAAGLARVGFFPIVYGLSAFIPIRVLEQIKLDVCHDELPVIFLGDGAGFVYSSLGTSHQSTEDIGVTRSIPFLDIYSPADRFEITAVLDLAESSRNPSYIRIGKSDLGDVHSAPITITKNKLLPINISDSPITFIATGSMVKVAANLSKIFKNANVWSAPCLKPINTELLFDIFQKSKIIVTFEEHNIYGGLGGIIAEISSEIYPLPILRIGVNDCFSKYCGTYQYLLEEHGLNFESIKSKIHSHLEIHQIK